MKRKNIAGWLGIFTVFFIYIMNTGVPIYGASIINTKMALEQGLDITVLGYASSACGLLRAVTAALGGGMIARFGAHRMLAFGSLCSLLVASALAFLPLGLYPRIIVFSLYGVGIIFGALLTTPVLVREWFVDDSTLPMAIALSSGAVSGMVASVMVEQLTARFGWRSGWIAGAVCGALALLLSALLPRGSQTPSAPERKEGAEYAPHTIYRRQRTYYLLAVAYAVRTAVYNITVIFVMARMLDAGYTSQAGSQAMLLLSLFGLVGRLAQGWFGRTRLPLAIQACLSGLGVAGGCLLLISRHLPLLMLGSAIIGFCYGCGYILMPLLNGVYFSADQYAKVTGEIITWAAALGAAGPLLAAHLIRSCGYVTAFLLMAILCALSGVGNLLLPSSKNDTIPHRTTPSVF